MVKSLNKDSSNSINTNNCKTKAASDSVLLGASDLKEGSSKSRIRFSGFSKKTSSASTTGNNYFTKVSSEAETQITESYFRVADASLQQPTSLPKKDSALSHYEGFASKKHCLSKIINDASQAIQALNLDHFTKKLQDISNRISNETFKIQIVGTFKNGKSTFINSFLGKEILPAYALPCTAVINEVKYAEKKRAVLH